MRAVISKVILCILAAGLSAVCFGCTTPATVSQSSTAITTPVAPVTTALTTGTSTAPVVVTTASTTSTVAVTSTPNPTPIHVDGQPTPMTRWQYTVYRFRNLVSFDAVHKGTLFQVSGKVTDIITTAGSPYIVVNDGSLPASYAFASEWQCYFQTDASLINGVKIGQNITVVGIWGRTPPGGLVADPVHLDNCDIVS